MQRTDEQLVAACRAGDESAWEVIVLRHQKILNSIPRRAGLGDDLAADILQDVFTTLFERLETLEKPEFLRAWLITTTRHKTIHLIRRETRGRPRSIDDDEGEFAFEIADVRPLADEVLVKLERDERIGRAFDELDDRCRRLLTMLYLAAETLPYTDVSEQLGIPLGSIGPTRARCLQKLVKFLPE